MEVSNLAKAITEKLEKYSDEFAEKVKKNVEEVAKECATNLQQTSPQSKKASSKRYAKGWTYKKEFESNSCLRYRVLNKNKPQLTHLLEYGHAKVNGGRVNAILHIKKAEEMAKENLLKKIKEM